MKTPQKYLDAYREFRSKALQGDAAIRELKGLLNKAREKSLPSWECFLEGCIAAEKGQDDETLRLYEKALEHDPDNSFSWNSKGVVLHDLGRYEEALVVNEESIRLDPNDFKYWNNKGNALKSLGRYEEALTAYEESIRLGLNEPAPWYGKGNVLNKFGRSEEALVAYEESIRLAPNKFFAWNGKGNVLGQLGQHENALAAYEESIRLDPNNFALWSNKGSALSELGRYNEALVAYEESIRLDPNNPGLWNNKGNALSALDRSKEAITAYEESIRLDPNEPAPWYGKGNALGLLGRYKETLAAYNEAIRLNPNDPKFWNGKGNALSLQGRYREALVAYEESIRLDPTNPKPWNGRGGAYFLLPDNDSACRCFRRFCKLAVPDDIFNMPKNLHLSLAQEAWNPFLIHRLVRENPGLLALAEFRDDCTVVEEECETPLVLMEVLDSGLCVLEERERLLVGGLLCHLHGDPIQAEEAWLDQLNDRYPDDLLGQYYLVSAIKDSFGDAGAALDEALSKAEALLGAGSNDPEQLYYAGMLFRLAGRTEDALCCFAAAETTAPEQGYPAAGIMRAIVLDEGERDVERDESVESILVAEHTRAGIGNQGWLAGFAVQEINFLEAGWDRKVVRLAQTLECAPIISLVGDWLDTHPDVADPFFLEVYRGYLSDTNSGMRGAWTLAEGAWDRFKKEMEERAGEDLAEARQAFVHERFKMDRLEGTEPEELELELGGMIAREGKTPSETLRRLTSFLFRSGRLHPAQAVLLSLYADYRRGERDKRTMASSAAMVARVVGVPTGGAYAGALVGGWLDLGPGGMNALVAGAGGAMGILGQGIEYRLNFASGDTGMSYPEFRAGFNEYTRRT